MFTRKLHANSEEQTVRNDILRKCTCGKQENNYYKFIFNITIPETVNFLNCQSFIPDFLLKLNLRLLEFVIDRQI